MEKRNRKHKPQDLVSQDDGGLRMTKDLKSKDHKEKVMYVERPQEETTETPPTPPVITGFYSGMDDVGVDEDVFIQQQSPSHTSYTSPLLPAEGSRDETVNNSSLTFANGAADATEGKANPGGLDWHHGEEQLMAAQNPLDELIAGTAQTSEEFTNTAEKDYDSKSMEDTGGLKGPRHDSSGEQRQDNTTRNKELTKKPEETSERQETWKEVEADGRKKHPKQVPFSLEEMSKNETHFYRDGPDGVTSPAETKSRSATDKLDCSGVKQNAPVLSSPRDRDDDDDDDDNLKPCGQQEYFRYNQNNMEEAINQSQASQFATNLYSDDEECVDTRSLNYQLTKYDWERRESGISDTLTPRLPISEGSEGNRGITSNIQQGEQLLQRLQMVQQRQDDSTPESPRTPQQDVKEKEDEHEAVFAPETDETNDDLISVGESSIFSFEDDGAKANLKEEKPGNEHAETKAWSSLPTMTVKPDHCPVVRTELVDSDDDKSETWGGTDETPDNPLIPTRQRLSVAETSLEKQIHEVAQKKQNLQRAGGVFNLADNLDVIEIPFKTNFSLEPLPAKATPGQRISWQFSEQKMQKEINQEIQRELVLVNQGKIPGAYSKGEVRQLKETKLLFEAFQQENMEGPTRHRKSPTSMSKGHVYPSVLERTRSLEMFSLKSLPVSRTHSLRVHDSAAAQMKKSPEDVRAKSPNGGSREKSRMSPYQKQDKHARQYRSMDLISSGVLAVDGMREVTEANMLGEASTLNHNPFFKLRPALLLQPEVEKDIREAKEREEELRRQRCTLYGESRCKSKEKEKSRFTPALTDATGQSRGKLDRFWPPPSKKDQKPEQIQQETKVRRTAGQKASLWQRWESGQINGQPSQE